MVVIVVVVVVDIAASIPGIINHIVVITMAIKSIVIVTYLIHNHNDKY